jgi:O-antigen/teichoic acid export membrane protein
MPFFKNLTVGLTVGALTQALSASVTILVIRKLGPHDRGVYAMVVVLNTMLTYFLDLGISAGNETFLGKKEHSLGSLNWNSTAYSLILGSLAVVLGYAFRKTLEARILPGVNPSFILLGLLLLPFTLYCLYAESMLVGIEEIVLLNKLSLLQSSIVTLGSIFFVLALGGGVEALLFVWGTAFVVTALCFFIAIWSRDQGGFDPSLLWKSLSFGLRAFMARAFFRPGSLRLDSFLVNAIIGTTAVGYYSVATAITDRVGPILRAVLNAANRRITGADRQASLSLTAKLTRNLILILVPCVAIAILSSQLFIRVLFGPAFLPSVVPFRILCLGIIFFLPASVLVLFFQNQKGRPGFASTLIGALFLISIPLYLLAVPRWGLAGAALGTAITQAGIFLALLVAFLKESKFGAADLLFAQKEDIQTIVNSALPRELIRVVRRLSAKAFRD